MGGGGEYHFNIGVTFTIPYDVGQLPTNIKSTDDLALLTAQQWKNFACIYARPCFVGLLSVRAYKWVLISIDEVATLHRLLNEHHILFASVYGKWEVIINYHIWLCTFQI